SLPGKKPQFEGMLTNDIIYSRLAPGVLNELRAKNPRRESGSRSHKHHQYLTRDLGLPKMLQHLAAVLALMRASSTKADFKKSLNRALPKYVSAPLFEQLDQ